VIILSTATSRCAVDDEHGARLASLQLGGHEVLVTGTGAHDPLRWGCYPMVPWAGRIRDARVHLDDTDHFVTGVGSSGPHPLHGSVADRRWTATTAGTTRVRCQTDLGDRWPVAGSVLHEITLEPDAVTCTLGLTAGDRGFPAQVGWHPWFPSTWTRHLGFRARYRRDAAILPTGHLDPVADAPLDASPLDDCFVGPRWAPRLLHADGTELAITSDCTCWVVYDEPGHAVCIEPQSGPPDGVNLEPAPLPAGATMLRWMRIALVRRGPSVTGE